MINPNPKIQNPKHPLISGSFAFAIGERWERIQIGCRRVIIGFGLATVLLLGIRSLVMAVAAPERTSIIIGVWYQSGDPTTIAKWKARGVRTYVGPPSINGIWNLAAYTKNLNAQGMNTFTMATDASTAKDITLRPDYAGFPTPANDPNNIGFSGWLVEPDEPDLDIHMVGYPNAIDKDATVSLWVSRCNYLRGISPSTPQMGGFTGNDLSYCYNAGAKNRHTFTGLTWTDFEKMAAPLDFVNSDYYPITVGADISALVPRVVATAALANGKPWMVFIECADQHLSDAGRAPTPAEVRGETWMALIHGASGICYFPQSVGTHRPPTGRRDDNTPADVAAELVSINNLIKAQEFNLLRPGVMVTCPAPFYKRIVTAADGSHVSYTLNYSSQTRVWPEDGTIYAPFELKIDPPTSTGDGPSPSPTPVIQIPTFINVFNPSRDGLLTIPFQTREAAHVTMTLYDRKGLKVKTLFEGDVTTELQHTTWDGKNEMGSIVVSGVYIIELKTGDTILKKQLGVIK